jgi:hypothetical protein
MKGNRPIIPSSASNFVLLQNIINILGAELCKPQQQTINNPSRPSELLGIN